MNGLKATSTHRSNVARLKLLFGPPLTRSMSFEEAPRQWGDLRMRSSWRLGASKHPGISACWSPLYHSLPVFGHEAISTWKRPGHQERCLWNLWHAQFSWLSPCSMRVSVVFDSCIAFFTTSFWESCNILQLLRCCFWDWRYFGKQITVDLELSV